LKSAQCVSMYFTSCSRSFTSSHTQASIWKIFIFAVVLSILL
jgi:hypothetical protein